MIGQDIQTSSYWPPATTPEAHSDSTIAPRDDSKQPWILVNSTPATCTQLGLHHFFSEHGPIDLVVSGPNYGRNTTAIFALSSGTLGAALESAVCGYRSIALSFAFDDRTNAVDVVAESCRHAVRVCEWLARNASFEQGRLYSVNVPVKAGVSARRVAWTRMLQNQWKKGACFQEVESGEMIGGPDVEEARTRRRESDGDDAEAAANGDAAVSGSSAWKRRHFKWAPRFTDVYESIEKAGPESDGWTVKQGETSVTALRANFMHVEGMEGEVKL